MPRPPNHASFAQKLELLCQFKREHGHTNVKRSDPDRALSNWVAAQKQAFAAGTLSSERTKMLEELGFVFPEKRSRPVETKRSVRTTAGHVPSFDEAFEQLSQWLDEQETTTGQRNLAYRDTRTSALAKGAYLFVERMALQARHGLLSDKNRVRLAMLAFTVNGQSIHTFFPNGPICSAKPNTTGAATNVACKDALPTGDERIYLTTEQLAARLNYCTKTIRETLKDRVFVENRHYLRPAGRRKILWLWDAISADIHSGSCKLATDGTSAAAG